MEWKKYLVPFAIGIFLWIPAFFIFGVIAIQYGGGATLKLSYINWLLALLIPLTTIICGCITALVFVKFLKIKLDFRNGLISGFGFGLIPSLVSSPFALLVLFSNVGSGGLPPSLSSGWGGMLTEPYFYLLLPLVFVFQMLLFFIGYYSVKVIEKIVR